MESYWDCAARLHPCRVYSDDCHGAIGTWQNPGLISFDRISPTHLKLKCAISKHSSETTYPFIITVGYAVLSRRFASSSLMPTCSSRYFSSSYSQLIYCDNTYLVRSHDLWYRDVTSGNHWCRHTEMEAHRAIHRSSRQFLVLNFPYDSCFLSLCRNSTLL